MLNQANLTLVNQQNGNLAFKIMPFDDNGHFDHVQRHNYYSMLLITKGEGVLKADFAEYPFVANTLMCFVPYQPFMLHVSGSLKGVMINFHPDFFCIHKNNEQVACSGVLFNNIYNPPMAELAETELRQLQMVIEQMTLEMQQPNLAQYELLVSYLKIFLITATRSKLNQYPEALQASDPQKAPFILQTLKDAIEKHYKTKHSASDYAQMLNISAKYLAKLTKNHINKTLTDLIAERIVIEAKRELYLTSKPIKTIAGELGFNDEYYFSRFFKTNADVSPQLYRDTVGFARAEA